MTPPPLARRRAEAFDAALERGGVDGVAGLPPGSAALLGVVAGLREVAAESEATARPAFVSDLRERLLLAAATELTPVAATPVRSRVSPPARTRRERGVAIAVGALAIVGATTSMAVASQSALPGEVLYPVKRVLEDADTRLSADDQRGPELLTQATSRLTELDALSRRDQGRTVDPAAERALNDTLSTFADQASDASEELLQRFDDTGDVQSVSTLKQFTADSLDELVTLEATLPDAVRPAVLDAAQVLFVIDQAADAACGDCGGFGITDIPPTLVAATTVTELLDRVTAAVAAQPAPESPTPSLPAKPRATATPTTPAQPAPPTQPAQPTPTDRPSQPTQPTPRTDDVLPTAGTTKKVNPGTGGVLGDLGTLLGGQQPSADPSAPTLGGVVGGVVGGTLDGVNGLTGGLLGPRTTPTP